MAKNTRNIVVFYDSPCIDGAASAWCFERKYSDDPEVNLELIPLPHGDLEIRKSRILENIINEAEVYFVDTSPKKEELKALMSPFQTENRGEENGRVKSVTVWDHHESEAVNNFKPPETEGSTLPDIHSEIDVNMPSAAIMVWKKLFNGEPPPEIFEWIGKMEPPVTLKNHTEYAVSAFLDSKDISSPGRLVSTFNELSRISTKHMVAEGNAILADQLNNAGKLLENGMYAYLELLPGCGKMWMPVFNANVRNFGRGIDSTLIEVANKGTTPGVAGAWFLQGDGTVKLSLRTSGYPDAEKIAKHLEKTVGIDSGGRKTAGSVTFKDLRQFVDHVPLYTKEQMRKMQWTPVEGPKAPACEP
jgi:hypothetical protein